MVCVGTGATLPRNIYRRSQPILDHQYQNPTFNLKLGYLDLSSWLSAFSDTFSDENMASFVGNTSVSVLQDPSGLPCFDAMILSKA